MAKVFDYANLNLHTQNSVFNILENKEHINFKVCKLRLGNLISMVNIMVKWH